MNKRIKNLPITNQVVRKVQLEITTFLSIICWLTVLPGPAGVGLKIVLLSRLIVVHLLEIQHKSGRERQKVHLLLFIRDSTFFDTSSVPNFLSILD